MWDTGGGTQREAELLLLISQTGLFFFTCLKCPQICVTESLQHRDPGPQCCHTCCQSWTRWLQMGQTLAKTILEPFWCLWGNLPVLAPGQPIPTPTLELGKMVHFQSLSLYYYGISKTTQPTTQLQKEFTEKREAACV